MKVSTSPAVSLYDRRKPRQIRSVLFFIILLAVFLLGVYFFNLFMQWTVIRLEIQHGPVFRTPEYSFFGFSLLNQREIAAVRFFENSFKPTRVFGFFDFYHPAVFAVWNKNDLAFIDFGPIVIAVPAGFSRISFFPGSVFLLEHENKGALKYFGAYPAGSLWHRFLAGKFNASRSFSAKPLAASFVMKEIEKSRYLKIPYLIYFYLPLLMIVFLAIRYGLVWLTAFFYYAEMFFLFDYRKLFVSVPFDWILKLFNWEISPGLVEVTAKVMVAIFVLCAVFGLWHWGKSNMPSWGKKIILFFILLPFFLFF